MTNKVYLFALITLISCVENNKKKEKNINPDAQTLEISTKSSLPSSSNYSYSSSSSSSSTTNSQFINSGQFNKGPFVCTNELNHAIGQKAEGRSFNSFLHDEELDYIRFLKNRGHSVKLSIYKKDYNLNDCNSLGMCKKQMTYQRFEYRLKTMFFLQEGFIPLASIKPLPGGIKIDRGNSYFLSFGQTHSGNVKSFCYFRDHFDKYLSDQTKNMEIEEIRSRNDVPALAGALIKGNKLDKIAVVGRRKHKSNFDSNFAQEDDLFNIGSNTKSMTASLIAKLIEEGKLSWDSTIAQLLTDSGIDFHPAHGQTTIKMILAMHGGLARDISGVSNDPGYKKKLYFKENLHLLLKDAPVFRPGDRFSYSNRAYALAGALTELVSGKPYETLMQEKVFAPLGMSSCQFSGPGDISDHNKMPKSPWGHFEATDVATKQDMQAVYGPAGRVRCNLADWAKYMQAHLLGGSGQDNFLTTASFEILHSKYPNSSYTYGGWFRTGNRLYHQGNTGNFFSYALIDFSSNIAAMAVTNISSGAPVRSKDAVLETVNYLMW